MGDAGDIGCVEDVGLSGLSTTRHGKLSVASLLLAQSQRLMRNPRARAAWMRESAVQGGGNCLTSSSASKGLRFRAQKLPSAQTMSSALKRWHGAVETGRRDKLAAAFSQKRQNIRAALSMDSRSSEDERTQLQQARGPGDTTYTIPLPCIHPPPKQLVIPSGVMISRQWWHSTGQTQNINLSNC